MGDSDLVGDRLPNATLKQLVAAGFNRNTLTGREGGFEKEMARAENLGTLWLGLTLGCARCHDHKFDPLTQKDHYYVKSVPSAMTIISRLTPSIFLRRIPFDFTGLPPTRTVTL